MEKEINLIELLKLYLHRWWILLIGMIIGGILMGMYTSFFIAPTYVSAGSLYTQNSSGSSTQGNSDVNLNTIMVRKELVSSYAEVLSSNVFLKKVATESGLGYSHEDLLRMISMSSKNETEILVISVTSLNPQHAYIIAQTIINLADEQIESVIEGGGVKILDEPEYSDIPASPNLSKNVLLGMIAGFILCAVVIFLMDMFSDKVKNTDDLTRKFALPVLGEIPYFVNETPGDSSIGSTHVLQNT